MKLKNKESKTKIHKRYRPNQFKITVRGFSLNVACNSYKQHRLMVYL